MPRPFAPAWGAWIAIAIAVGSPACLNGSIADPAGAGAGAGAASSGVTSTGGGAAASSSTGPDCETCGGTVCVDVTADPLHCGDCAHACGAEELCYQSQCTTTCDALTACAGTCVDTMIDPKHCGGCDSPCGPGKICEAGMCACAADPATLAMDVQPIFTAHCAAAGCHTGAMPKEGLSLTAGDSFAGLVGVKATECTDGRLRVAPGEPGESYLMDKLLNKNLCGAGVSMPKGGMLDAAAVTTIAVWICAGALDD